MYQPELSHLPMANALSPAGLRVSHLQAHQHQQGRMAFDEDGVPPDPMRGQLAFRSMADFLSALMYSACTLDDKRGGDRLGRLPFMSTATKQLKEVPSVWDEVTAAYPHMGHLTQGALLQDLKQKSACIQNQEQQLTEQVLQTGLVRAHWEHYHYFALGEKARYLTTAHLTAARSQQAEMEQRMAKLKTDKAELWCSLKQLMPTKQQEQYKEHSPAQH